MADDPKQGTGRDKLRDDPEAEVGGNAPRGDEAGYPEIGEAGGPAGVEPSGGAGLTREREGSGVPPGMTPGDLQKSPEEILEDWGTD
jgi:hypothetical protein